jgi:hypothetical protein
LGQQLRHMYYGVDSITAVEPSSTPNALREELATDTLGAHPLVHSTLFSAPEGVRSARRSGTPNSLRAEKRKN